MSTVLTLVVVEGNYLPAKRGQAAAMKTYVKVSFLILIFQRFDFIIQRFDGKRLKRKVNLLVLPLCINTRIYLQHSLHNKITCYEFKCSHWWNIYKKNPLQDLLSSKNALISTNESTRFIYVLTNSN